AASILAYICIGAVGLPVFANMAAGVQVLTGMTAGFLWAYPLMAALLAAVCRRTQRMALRLAGVLAGQLVCYALGTVWFMFVSGMGLWASLTVCVLPFILPDFLKGLGALALAGAIRRRLKL
ncbi:biotin transporter BioY, partial [Actinomyces radicidentis]|uniref:biotin transporter BioY n=1 Tax=Actinomyces radicidentis TaxID=111015 RepID=UPI0026E0A504